MAAEAEVPAAALTVWRFGSATGAPQAARRLEQLNAKGSLVVANAAVVAWSRGTPTPRVEHLALPPVAGTLTEPFWGLLFGLVFYMPLIGAAVGATTGTLTGPLADVGIDDTFISKVRDRVTPGTSALFVLTEEADPGEIRKALAVHEPTEVLFTNLRSEHVQALRSVFG
ncbi:DUF1269 domain-containing protein [Marmoricola sp. RAF53]|uniref:DUF1269 domain-containing protein n=1 Tax=Marmoricola sp. RAF53 TaxID=3233059 RepID=UPI003F9DFD4F